ncbi:MAG TPA: lipoprotein-releasing ABC transporter permease subunit [Steroidobacteraceae bacterium]|nr:lipoprotein-releasing ABC transporter permease subunit [Steroidobacteraceae bacterium]
MSRVYEWLVGTRYLRSAHRRGFVSFVALMSVCGLALGVATLIVVLSVMNGFGRELRARILSVTADGTIMGLQGTLSGWQALQQRIEREPGVRIATPYVESQAMLTHGEDITGASVRGVLPEEERRATGLAQRVVAGSLEDLQPGRYRVILGSALAQALRVRVGESVVLIAPQGVATPTGVMPRMRRFQVAGLFHSGMYEYDRGLALVSLTDAARLFDLAPGQVTGLRLSLDDPWQAPKVVRRVAYELGGPGYYVSDWTENHANFFRSIESTKSLMFVMLSMIVAVAAFNIVATLVMIVKEKQTDIAILRTFGAGPRNVLAIFAIQGILIGLAGTLLGAGLGILISHNLQALVGGLERLLHTQFLDPRVYYMSDLPAHVEGFDVLRVCAIAFLLCALATLYPAWRAGRTAPAQALRHE